MVIPNDKMLHPFGLASEPPLILGYADILLILVNRCEKVVVIRINILSLNSPSSM
jgi:hypothetical protein